MPPARGATAGAKIHKCPDCDKTFSRKEYVVRHSRLTHQGARPYGCSSCDSTFARSDLLKRHERTCNSKPKDQDDQDDELASAAPEPVATLGESGPSFSTLADHQQLYHYPPSTSTSSTTSYVSPTLPSLSPASAHSSTSAESPDTPFSPPTTTEVPVLSAPLNVFAPSKGLGKQQTLAPEFTRSFSQDEILASEVLEDLLRSPPQYAQQSTGFLDPSAFGTDSTASTSQNGGKPWHGGMAMTGASNESVAAVGSQGWDIFDGGEEGIENSPAAMALADYFNKGGVGGISALDLGFSHTPSLFPDHVFEPQYVHAGEERFFLPAQKFCMGYLFPWNVPKIDTLSHYGKTAAEKFLPSVPIIHPGTMFLSELPTHSAFALTVAGAAYSPEGEGFSNEMLVEKRVYLVRGFNKEGTSDEDRFATLQSMLLYQLLGLFHRDEQQRILSHTFHGALVSMLRQLELPRKIKEKQLVPPHRLMQGAELEAAWKAWIEVETWRRVSFIVFLTDIETATRFETSPFLPFSELALDLPSSDALWNAGSAQEWLNLMVSPLNPTPVSFLEAVRVLLSPTEPMPFESGGILLAELGRLSSFPLLILSRTLSFLQAKTEEAIKQADPFRTLLGGFGILEGREQENRDVLARIVRGRETLKRLPGGVKRGGGEKWFEGVVPVDTTSSAPSTSASPSTTLYDFTSSKNEVLGNQEDYNRKLQAKMDAMARHRERRANEVVHDFPDFMMSGLSSYTTF
ncbi:hypothetical protein BCR35DRAFT_304607 [Leucosporidium creatinivorum]|uniref:C2H2-type domain-containing protein n=1 Tax=Leucosporidium creatinivorum TaxID=106004 RepID=A0A1Y2F8V3_9BASI|nr:hypothetical protein BCR35DRAFT_304607 [Leucosporidium creatinivorum]